MPDELASLFKLRVRYAKRGRLAYLSHLEVLRACERTVMRAGLPFAVTQGFSPRMRIAFGPALPVGVSSQDEWYDLVLTEYVPAQECLGRLRSSSVDDLMPLQAEFVGMRDPSLSAALTIARWGARVFMCDRFGAELPARDRPWDGPELGDALGRAVQGTLDAGSISYLRNGKDKTVGLAGKVAQAPVLFLSDDGAAVRMEFATRASNQGALRPDVFLGDVLDRCQAILTAGPARRPGCEAGDVSSPLARLRASISRTSQLIECEDGTWHRPI